MDSPTREEQERVLQMLSGGLHGRFAQSFCVMQGDLDAVERVLLQKAEPALRAELLPLLRDMACRLPELERLADQTADIALGSALRTVHRQDVLDLTILLDEFAMDVRTELFRRGRTAELKLEKQTASLPLIGDSSLIFALLANLFSNALAAKADALLTWTVSEGMLVCRDDGPGLPESLWPVLLERPGQTGLPNHGGTGLLLIRQYADCLGWTISRQGDAICFTLPSFPADRAAEFASAVEESLLQEQVHRILVRELDALALRNS